MSGDFVASFVFPFWYYFRFGHLFIFLSVECYSNAFVNAYLNIPSILSAVISNCPCSVHLLYVRNVWNEFTKNKLFVQWYSGIISIINILLNRFHKHDWGGSQFWIPLSVNGSRSIFLIPPDIFVNNNM